jgi:hypothetical protein
VLSKPDGVVGVSDVEELDLRRIAAVAPYERLDERSLDLSPERPVRMALEVPWPVDLPVCGGDE